MTFLIVCVAAMRCGKARGRATLPGVETARHCSRPLKELPNLKPLVRHRTTLPAPAEARWKGLHTKGVLVFRLSLALLATSRCSIVVVMIVVWCSAQQAGDHRERCKPRADGQKMALLCLGGFGSLRLILQGSKTFSRVLSRRHLDSNSCHPQLGLSSLASQRNQNYQFSSIWSQAEECRHPQL